MAQVRRIDGEFGRSLVCIGSVLSLAVVPTALQKLHKCVTQNTTELLQDTERDKEKEEQGAFKNTDLKRKETTRGGSVLVLFALALKRDKTAPGGIHLKHFGDLRLGIEQYPYFRKSSSYFL